MPTLTRSSLHHRTEHRHHLSQQTNSGQHKLWNPKLNPAGANPAWHDDGDRRFSLDLLRHEDEP